MQKTYRVRRGLVSASNQADKAQDAANYELFSYDTTVWGNEGALLQKQREHKLT